MYSVTGLTNDAKQVMSLNLPSGGQVTLSLEYKPLQLGWFITQLLYSVTGKTINGLRLCTSTNVLRQFANQMPFGLACLTTDGQEANLQTDFTSGRAQLYILSRGEVLLNEGTISGASILYGSGAPASTLGKNGIFYFDEVAFAYYENVGGTWEQLN